MKKALVKFNIIICIFLFAAISGCGVKSNPVVLKKYSVNIQVVRNLKVAASDQAMLLKRHVNAPTLKHHDIALQRSVGDTKGNYCKDCLKSL